MPQHAQIQAAAESFWQRVGSIEPFPRTLEQAIMLALPVTIIKLSMLHLATIEHWFRQRQVAYQFPCENRRVRGCLVAYCGQGLIFVDQTDPPGEVRLTLAHEAAHFLEDYLIPRLEAIKRLGPEIIEVLDGLRAPTVKERVHALLASVPLAVYHRYMERGAKGELTLSAVWDAEDRADRLALELVAPSDDVLQQTRLTQPRYQERRTEMVRVLTTTFGLPTDLADLYGRGLLQSSGKGPSFLEQLGLRTT